MTEMPAFTDDKDTFFTIRVPQHVIDELKAVASKNERSLSAEARLALRAWLERYQDQAPS